MAWQATSHQRFERLLRETGVHGGVLIPEKNDRKDGEDRLRPEVRLPTEVGCQSAPKFDPPYQYCKPNDRPNSIAPA
jgi:hypothetical protein